MKTLAFLVAALFTRNAHAATVYITAYNADGHILDLSTLQASLLALSPDGLSPGVRLHASSSAASWDNLPRAKLVLPWPITGDGYAQVSADNNGEGFADGDTIILNEAIATTQYRLFQDSWRQRTAEWKPLYAPSAKGKTLAERARMALAAAQEFPKDSPKRASAFDQSLAQTARAQDNMLFEHGLQIARHHTKDEQVRFGLTLDDTLPQRVGDYKQIIDAVSRSRSNWVRVVFRANSQDFTYATLGSFNEYDAIIAALGAHGIHVMGTVLDTAQWPSTLTPALYAQRTKNIVLHYRESIKSWEVGVELNGDWLGGKSTPLAPDRVFDMYAAAAAQVKAIDPNLETVATLYWWEATAPDEKHSLFGWLRHYEPRGFDTNLDVLGLSLQPDDNPVGVSFEEIFTRVSQTVPHVKLMLSSFGYVEGSALHGYWWLDPKDIDGARQDLVSLYTAAACAMPRSLCGGFWWQTLDQMLDTSAKPTPLYRTYQNILARLGRRGR